MAELTDNILQFFCIFVCGVYSCFQSAAKKSYKWLFISLFYLSFGIGLLYWVLYIVLFHSTPRVFFVSELNWTASYIFLAISLVSDMSEDERKFKLKPVFWVLPAFSFIMCIFFCLRGSYFENILMGSAMAACGFYAVKGIYFSKQKNTKHRCLFSYAVLFFYAAEYLLWICSYFYTENTFINPYFLADTFILNPALVMIAFAQAKEDKTCHTA